MMTDPDDRDALMRLARFGRGCLETHREIEHLRAHIAALEAELERVKRAAINGMNAATAHGHGLVEQAARLRAESNPDALESERAMNAALTEQLERAELARQDALAELAAARVDAERMEWLAANKYSISYEPTPDDELGDGIEIVLFPMFPHMQKHVQAGSDLRKAIDAARGPA